MDLLRSSRLLTLTGVGGTGKTRLSLSVAHHVLADFADGVWGRRLASQSDTERLAATVALTLGLKFSAGVVSAERVVRAVASKQILIVLDNCEHVVATAADMTEALLLNTVA